MFPTGQWSKFELVLSAAATGRSHRSEWENRIASSLVLTHDDTRISSFIKEQALRNANRLKCETPNKDEGTVQTVRPLERLLVKAAKIGTTMSSGSELDRTKTLKRTCSRRCRFFHSFYLTWKLQSKVFELLLMQIKHPQ